MKFLITSVLNLLFLFTLTFSTSAFAVSADKQVASGAIVESGTSTAPPFNDEGPGGRPGSGGK